MTKIDPNTTFHGKLIELASNPSGFAASEVSGYSPEQVRRAAEGLAGAGHIVRVRVSARRIRYFSSDSLGQAYVKGKATSSTLAARQTSGLRAKAKWGPDEPIRITSKTKIYIAPPLPRNVLRTYTYPKF